MTPISDVDSLAEPDDWIERERYWRRRLGRLRLGVEPLDVQLQRMRRVTWGLTVVPAFMGAIIAGLFAAFGAPGVGLAVAGILFGPIVALAWLDLKRTEGRARAYEADRRAFEVKKAGVAKP